MRMLALLAVMTLLVGGGCLQSRQLPPDPTTTKEAASRRDEVAPAPAPVALPPREPMPLLER